jgi:hypothetical protein
VGSNHRQHDYESCALPLSYAARSGLQRAGLAFAFALSLRFLARCLASATRFRLFRTAKPLVSFRTGTAGAPFRHGWGLGGCGGRIRTDDLRVMSPTSCRCSTPPPEYTSPRAAAARRRAGADRDARRAVPGGAARHRQPGLALSRARSEEEPTRGQRRPPCVIQSQAWRTAPVRPSNGPEAWEGPRAAAVVG